MIREAPGEQWHQIVGVARNVYDDGLDKPPSVVAYWPLYQDQFNGDKEMMRRYVSFVVRSPRAGSSAFVSEIQHAVWSVNADLPLDGTTTLGELYSKSMARTSFTLVMLCVAGGMALLLGIVGIYGVIAFAVAQRTREIGIRMALGARREALTGMFVRQGLSLTLIGLAAGLAVAFACGRFLRSILFGVSPMDPWTYAIAALSIVAICVDRLLPAFAPGSSGQSGERAAGGVTPLLRKAGSHTAIRDTCAQCDQWHRQRPGLPARMDSIRPAYTRFMPAGSEHLMSDLAPLAEAVAVDPLVGHPPDFHVFHQFLERCKNLPAITTAVVWPMSRSGAARARLKLPRQA